MRRSLHAWIRYAAAATLWGAAHAAFALASCTASASTTAFGTYLPTAASPLDSVGNVQVSCSLLGVISIAVAYTISLSTGSSGSYSQRVMSSGGPNLDYNLYSNASRTSIWGNGSGGTSTVSDGYLLGLLTTTRNYPVYGRVAAGQNVPAGTYGDTITVQVDY